MDNVIITKTRQVGNSIAIFIPLEVKKRLELGPNEEVVATIEKRKKKNKADIEGLFGSLKGTKLKWNCGEDRVDRD
ncbi:hypothetical protein HY990_03895 [Candidatus Micrarchaeota archaeon]|nr:hypothetical protein [Candidatus Micrarchaeota archaeon]